MEQIKFLFDNMLAENFEAEEQGISPAEIDAMHDLYKTAYDSVIVNEDSATSAYFDLVRAPRDLDEIESFASEVRQKYRNFVILGIGGSALGTKVLVSALNHYSPEKRRKDINIKIIDVIDPEIFLKTINKLNLKATKFCVVTKSGNTLETLVQTTMVVQRLKKELGANYAEHICAITSNREGKLNIWCEKNNIKTFYFSNDLSGRFSVFSAVGLLPASVYGIDIRKLLHGANMMLELSKNADLKKNPALYSAVLHKICLDKGLRIAYLMPYMGRLRVLADWYCQLKAESLGKKVNNESEEFVGQTPVRAFGTVDQHSQLQLCLEGVYDKIITFIRVNGYDTDYCIHEDGSGLLDDYVYEHKLSEIVNSSQQATEQALLNRSRMNMTIELDKLDEYTLGELMMFFMIETSFLGQMLHIDTYTQPSVELIKQNIKKALKNE